MPKPITPSNPTAALVNLSLDAVALCNEGANSRAHILLTKRKETESMPTSFEELLKALNSDQADIVNKHITAIEAAKDGVIKGLETKVSDLEGKVVTLEKSKPAAQEEDVLKNASPEIKAMFEKMQSTVNSLVADREEELVKTRFEKMKALPVEETELKTVLKSASPAVVAILEKAATAVSEALTAKGKDTNNSFPGTSSEDHYSVLQKAAKTIQGESAGMTFEKAFTLACERNPEVYAKYVKGGN